MKRRVHPIERSGPRIHAIALMVVASVMLAACGTEPTDPDVTQPDPAPGEEAEAAPVEEEPVEEEPGAPAEPVDVTLFLPLPVLTVAMFPAVVADHQGFFEEEGLNVNVQTAGGSSLAVQQMAAGAGDAGLIISGSFVNAVAQGQDFVAVHDFILRPMFDLVVPADSPIQSYEDLDGARVGIDGLEAGELPELRGDLGAVGLEEGTDYTIVVLGDDHALAFEQLEQGRADTLSVAYNERVILEHRGYEFRTLEPPYTLDDARPAVPLIVTRAFLESNPEAVNGLGRALNKAVVFAHANPDATLAIMREAFPPEHDDPTFTRMYLEAGLELSDPWAPGVDEGRFGYMSMTGWEQLVQLLIEDPDAFPLEDHVTNEYIDAMNDFDVGAVQQQAEASELTYP